MTFHVAGPLQILHEHRLTLVLIPNPKHWNQTGMTFSTPPNLKFATELPVIACSRGLQGVI